MPLRVDTLVVSIGSEVLVGYGIGRCCGGGGDFLDRVHHQCVRSCEPHKAVVEVAEVRTRVVARGCMCCVEWCGEVDMVCTAGWFVRMWLPVQHWQDRPSCGSIWRVA